MTLPAFADLLNRYCDRPVIDMTGLAGSYDMESDVSAEELRKWLENLNDEDLGRYKM